MILLIVFIFLLSLYFHFEPSVRFFDEGIEVFYQVGGRYYDDKQSFKIYTMKIWDDFLNIMLMAFLILFGLYFSGFLVFLGGLKDEDKETMMGGIVLASINVVLIWLTFKLIGI